MKVIKSFFCVKEKKKYSVGDEYKGDRDDINHLLEPKKKVLSIEVETKPVEGNNEKPKVVKRKPRKTK